MKSGNRAKTAVIPILVPRLPSALLIAAAMMVVAPEKMTAQTLVASPSGADGAVPSVEIAPPSEDGRAAAYAQRYRISKDLALQIVQTALAEGIDPELAFRLIRVESVFRTDARGPSGSLGLTQLMPSTARAIDRSLRTEAQILEPEANLRTGFRYLRKLIERYKGDVRLGVLAYNRGETAVDRALRAGRDPENGYSRKVLGNAANRYTGKGVVEKK